MSEPGGSRSLLQFVVAFAVGVLGYTFGIEIGAVLLVVMALVWPPRGRWLPLPCGRVLGAYGPFAVVWLLFTIGYLQVMHAVDATVLPQPALARLAAEGMAMPGATALVFAIVVLGPVAEEILFRGYLFAALEQRLSGVATQLVTAALFGLVHGPDYALPIGVLALLFGWLRARYGSLLPSILAHAVHNGLTVAITLLWPGHLELLYPR
ncbi:MAG: CPBP family intramembrane metalloprotease [Planctomycetes bacterium]|nr:CPBP family intramembrane metalloprotease [Planctomycetota bacterium]